MSNKEASWSKTLAAHVEDKPIVVLNLDAASWGSLQESRRGVTEFTTSYPHGAFDRVKAPTICLLLANSDDGHHACLALIGSRSPITTLQSRVKIKRAVKIQPSSPSALVNLMKTVAYKRALRDRLLLSEDIIVLSPKLSGALIDRLASINANAGSMRALAAALSQPRNFRGNGELQQDAINTALKAFGLDPDDRADSLELVSGRDTALARVPIVEDGVIEHDARSVPGFDLVGSDRTGRAIFTRGQERLEIFTANRRQLERVLGVDLVYLNATRRNIVMLQYKMLNPPRGKSGDWTFVPDKQLNIELARMRRFAQNHRPPPNEYRLNPAIFYLKFVKKDGLLRLGGVILPVDHYDVFIQSPAARGPKGGIRVGYTALEGSYMRERPFLDLLHAGYIGAYADTTELLAILVERVLRDGRGLVAAIQSKVDAASP